MSDELKRTYPSWLNGEVKSEQKEYTAPTKLLGDDGTLLSRVGRVTTCSTTTARSPRRTTVRKNGIFIRFPTGNIWYSSALPIFRWEDTFRRF